MSNYLYIHVSVFILWLLHQHSYPLKCLKCVSALAEMFSAVHSLTTNDG